MASNQLISSPPKFKEFSVVEFFIQSVLKVLLSSQGFTRFFILFSNDLYLCSSFYNGMYYTNIPTNLFLLGVQAFQMFTLLICNTDGKISFNLASQRQNPARWISKCSSFNFSEQIKVHANHHFSYINTRSASLSVLSYKFFMILEWIFF